MCCDLQLHLDWLARAAAHVGPSGSAEQATAIAYHLAYHAGRLADLAVVSGRQGILPAAAMMRAQRLQQ